MRASTLTPRCGRWSRWGFRSITKRTGSWRPTGRGPCRRMTRTEQSGWATGESQKSGAILRATWEYLVITSEAESAAVLAADGSQGWELVAVVREFGTRATFYFKRRRS